MLGHILSYQDVSLKCNLRAVRCSIKWTFWCFVLTASEGEPHQDMRDVLPQEEGMVFLVLKTLVQRRVLMRLMKLPEEEISGDEAGVPHEVSMC